MTRLYKKCCWAAGNFHFQLHIFTAHTADPVRKKKWNEWNVFFMFMYSRKCQYCTHNVAIMSWMFPTKALFQNVTFFPLKWDPFVWPGFKAATPGYITTCSVERKKKSVKCSFYNCSFIHRTNLFRKYSKKKKKKNVPPSAASLGAKIRLIC